MSKTYSMQEICMTFLEKQRFYAVLLSKINKVEFKGIPTAAVGFNKHGKVTMFYNPQFLNTLTLEEAQGLVEHELLHIFWRHLTRFGMTGTSEKKTSIQQAVKDMHDHKIKNLGTDCSINQYIKVLPKGGVYPETFKLDREKNADFYIEEIRKLMPNPPKIENQCQTCGGTGKVQKQDQDGQGQQDQDDNGQDQQQAQSGGQPDQGHEDCPDCGGTGVDMSGLPDSLDDHSLWGKVVDVGEDGEAEISDCSEHDIDPEMECQKVVMKAINECKDYGKLPAHIAKEIEKLKAKERHDWKKTLRVFVNSVLTVSKKLSQKRVDRRMSTIVEYLMPGKKKSKKPSICYIRDTSGSMFDDSVQELIANELFMIAKRADVYVLDADTKVHQEYKFKKPSDLKPYKGGGGTCFKDALSKASKLGVDGVIYATDTYGSFPEAKSIGKISKSLIWLTFNQDKVDIPYGRHVNIPKNK
jgi:predicted metal-dependent peptidase